MSNDCGEITPDGDFGFEDKRGCDFRSRYRYPELGSIPSEIGVGFIVEGVKGGESGGEGAIFELVNEEEDGEAIDVR